MTIGERIKNLRTSKGMSQVELADKINVSKQTLYKYENNVITNIPSDKIEAIADLFGKTPSYIMGWDDDIPATQTIKIGLLEEQFLFYFRKLDKEHQCKILNRMELYLEDQDDIKKPSNVQKVRIGTLVPVSQPRSKKTEAILKAMERKRH